MKKRTSEKELKYLPIIEPLAVLKGKTDEEIYAMMDGKVSITWLKRKRSELEWNERPLEVASSSSYIVETMQKLLRNTVKQWDNDNAVIDGKMSDQLAKITSSIERVRQTVDLGASTQIVMNYWVKFLQEEVKDKKTLEINLPLVMEFTQYMRNILTEQN